jgi:cysteinyl-tRNA synthetase
VLPEPVAAFTEAMDADFNTPGALAAIFDLAREINRLRSSAAPSAELDRARATLLHLVDILGIDLTQVSSESNHQSAGPFIELSLDVRRKLREIKQWALADEIRVRLGELGVIVEDKPGGASSWRFDR